MLQPDAFLDEPKRVLSASKDLNMPSAFPQDELWCKGPH
jgi:hypothetical protein